MRSLSLYVLTVCSLLAVDVSDADRELTQSLVTQAEQLYQTGVYDRAASLWEKAIEHADDRQMEQYYRYRLADSGWRSINSAEASQLESLRQYRDDLERLAEELRRDAAGTRPPELWAQVMTSLADSLAFSPADTNAGKAWQSYDAVLNWWAGATDLEAARPAYLDLVWKASQIQYQTWPPVYRSRYWSPVNAEVYLNALTIAEQPEDRARAAFLLATAQTTPGDPQAVGDLLQQVVGEAQDTAWFAGLAFTYAQWLERYGRIAYAADGKLQYNPDYAAAVEWYRQVLALPEDESGSFRRVAQRQLDQLVEVSLNVQVEYDFLPRSVVTLALDSRNVSEIDVVVYRLDIDTEWTFAAEEESGQWYDAIRLDPEWKVRELEQTHPAEPYAPHTTKLRIEEGLDSGLYVVEARAGTKVARNYLQVGSTVLSGRVEQDEMLYYLADGFSGRALPGGKVLTLERVRNGDGTTGNWRMQRHEEVAEGLFQFSFADGLQRTVVTIGAVNGEAAVLSRGVYVSGRAGMRAASSWKVYAYADRPAYRPGEQAHWKMILRDRAQDGGYRIPNGEKVRVEIVDSANTVVSSEEATVSAMGTLWGEVSLPQDARLGMYHAVVYQIEGQKDQVLAWVHLFRVEEYRLPEYSVAVTAAGKDGETALLGDTVEAVVQVDYYAGGGVPAAEVELVVMQQPWYPFFPGIGMRPTDGFASGRVLLPRPIQGGEILHREKIVTDSNGKATFSFATSSFTDRGLRYEIQAHLVDMAGQAATGSTTLELSHQLYYAQVLPERYLHAPGKSQRIRIVTENAAQVGLSAQGRLKIDREEWYETWVGADGSIVSGESWREVRQRPGYRPEQWQFLRSEVRSEEVFAAEVTTDADGTAFVSFTPDQPGLYRAQWVSIPPRGAPVRADGTFWVADGDSDWVGVEPGFNLIVDTDHVRIGEDAVVMLTSPLPDQDVLLLVEGDGLIDYRLVRTRGGPALTRFEVDERWAPNVRFTALLVNDFRLSRESIEADVSPVSQYLQVEINGVSAAYAPGDAVELELSVTDAEGRPVEAELSLAVADQAVQAIQQELHASIIDYFYGEKRYFSSYFPSSLMLRTISRQQGETEDAVLAVSQEAESAYKAAAPQGVTLARNAAVQMDSVGGGSLDQVTVRDHFQSTAYWNPLIQTDAEGRATLHFTFPDNLTGWAFSAKGISARHQVGEAEVTARTNLPLLATVAVPRFLVAGDQSVVRGILRNTTTVNRNVEAGFEADGAIAPAQMNGSVFSVDLGPEAEAISSYAVTATEAGEGAITLRVLDHESRDGDGVERKVAVIEDGIEQQQWFALAAGGGESVTQFTLPPTIDGQTQVQLQLAAFPETALFAALPQLLAIEDDSVDALVDSFFPVQAVLNKLKAAGVDPENTDTPLPGVAQSPAALQQLIDERIDQLKQRQLPSGGWGWYPGGSENLYMTAYVLWGLSHLPLEHAARSEVAAAARGLLESRMNEMDGNHYLQVWLLHAISAEDQLRGERPSRIVVRTFTHLWRNRERMNSYGRSLLALAAHRLGFEDEARLLATSLVNGFRLIEDRQPGAAGSTVFDQGYWPLGTRQSWLWHNHTVEGTGFALQALLAIEGHEVPVDSVVRWLVLNRRGADWENHKTSAIAVVSLTASLASKEAVSAAAQFEIKLNGTPVGEVGYAAGEGALFSHQLQISADQLQAGENHLSLKRIEGGGVLYVSGSARYFTRGSIPAKGNFSAIERRLWRVDPVPTLLSGYVSQLQAITDPGQGVKRGERMDAVVIFELDNDFEYLKINDRRAAGLEAVEINSGYRHSLIQLDPQTAQLLKTGAITPLEAQQRQVASTRSRAGAYFEWRDSGLTVAIEKLPAGIWMLSYPLRAEFTGHYTWLPVEINTVYATEVFANGASTSIEIGGSHDSEE